MSALPGPAARRLELALRAAGTARPATSYAVAVWRDLADLLLTCQRWPSWPVARLRWILYADEDLELYQDLYADFCGSHDRRMSDKYLGCAPGWRGEGGRCGDVVAEDVLLVSDRGSESLLRCTPSTCET